MALSQLIYVSHATQKLSLRDTMTLMDRARPKNEQNGITGLLCYGGGYFLQVLEGDGDAVSETFARILVDSRHENVRIIDFSLIQARRFEDWSMHLINLDDPNRPEDSHRPEYLAGDPTHPFFTTDPQVAFWILYGLKHDELRRRS